MRRWITYCISSAFSVRISEHHYEGSWEGACWRLDQMLDIMNYIAIQTLCCIFIDKLQGISLQGKVKEQIQKGRGCFFLILQLAFLENSFTLGENVKSTFWTPGMPMWRRSVTSIIKHVSIVEAAMLFYQNTCGYLEWVLKFLLSPILEYPKRLVFGR